MAEDILTVTEAVDIVFWPVALDFKYEDVEKLQDGEITATLINGAVRMEEQEHMAKLLRRKSQIIIAHGSCAHLGGVGGLANFKNRHDILSRAYKKVPSVNNPEGTIPQTKTRCQQGELTLPSFYDTVRALNQVIEVDYYLPGCPPPPELVKTAVFALLEGKLPPKGSVIAESKALCDTCSRKETKPDKITVKEFKRVYETEWEATKCFLDQGIICLGPSTRGGCQERCLKGNFPCRGCFGPVDSVAEQGAKSLSAIASIIDTNDEDELQKIVETIPDPAGLFYRYSLATSLLKKKMSGGHHE